MAEFGNILYKGGAIRKQYGYYERPVFNSQARAGREINAESSWDIFKTKFNPFLTIDLSQYFPTETELFFTDKDVGWGSRDVNIWIGGKDREINEIDDLTESEAKIFFDFGLTICRNLKKYNGLDHSLSVGFNLSDIGLPGHHNVKRLHAHLRAYNDPYDLEKIEQRKWKDMHWFDRLSFIEPFTQVYFDFISNSLKQISRNIFDDIQMSEGVIDMPVKKGGEADFPATIINLYSSMKSEHQMIEDIFTAREIDPETSRYIPRERNEIEGSLSEFLSGRPYYSDRSQQLLMYLARHIHHASKRPQSRERYITDRAIAF